MDLDGRGRPSLLAGSNCCDGCGFFLFRRAADGSWRPRQRLTIATPEQLRPFRNETFVTGADWDGDGGTDLLAVEPNGWGIVAAPGSLGEAEQVEFAHTVDLPRATGGPGTDGIASFAVADWDRDGKPGVLVEHVREDRSTGLYWHKNLGGPGMKRLAPGRLVLDGAKGGGPTGFCVADWNGDDWPDLVAARQEPTRKGADGSPLGWQSSVWVYLRE